MFESLIFEFAESPSRPPNGPELSCGDEVPQRRNPVRAS